MSKNEILDWYFNRNHITCGNRICIHMAKKEKKFAMTRRIPMISFLQKVWNDVKIYLFNKDQSDSRILYFAGASILINIAIGLGKIIMGIYNHSFLFFVSGFYNLSLGFAKVVAVKGYAESKGKAIFPFTLQADKKHKEYRYYQLVGVILLLASFAYTIGSIGVLVGEHNNVHYSLIMVVEIGIITVIEIIVALQGVFARRREKEPILEAIKLTSLISSLIGLVLVQTAILNHAGGKTIIYFDYVGIFLGVVSFFIGVYMIISAKMKVVKQKKSQR